MATAGDGSLPTVSPTLSGVSGAQPGTTDATVAPEGKIGHVKAEGSSSTRASRRALSLLPAGRPQGPAHSRQR